MEILFGLLAGMSPPAAGALVGTLGALLVGIRHGALKTLVILAASGVGFVAWGIWGMGVSNPRRFAAEVAAGIVVGALVGTVLSFRVRRERSRT